MDEMRALELWTPIEKVASHHDVDTLLPSACLDTQCEEWHTPETMPVPVGNPVIDGEPRPTGHPLVCGTASNSWIPLVGRRAKNIRATNLRTRTLCKRASGSSEQTPTSNRYPQLAGEPSSSGHPYRLQSAPRHFGEPRPVGHPWLISEPPLTSEPPLNGHPSGDGEPTDTGHPEPWGARQQDRDTPSDKAPRGNRRPEAAWQAKGIGTPPVLRRAPTG